jgi:hypothetical protein
MVEVADNLNTKKSNLQYQASDKKTPTFLVTLLISSSSNSSKSVFKAVSLLLLEALPAVAAAAPGVEDFEMSSALADSFVAIF